MTNFDYVKTLDLSAFIDALSLPTGCPGGGNVKCDDFDVPTCEECWENWLKAEFNGSDVIGGKKVC